MEKIQIPTHPNNKYSAKNRDIETALAWSGVKKVLLESKHEDLFSAIKSIKITDKYITIITGRPIIITELTVFIPLFEDRFQSFALLKSKHVRLR